MAGKIRKTTKGKKRNFRTTKEGAGMTKRGVAAYKRKNPGSKLRFFWIIETGFCPNGT